MPLNFSLEGVWSSWKAMRHICSGLKWQNQVSETNFSHEKPLQIDFLSQSPIIRHCFVTILFVFVISNFHQNAQHHPPDWNTKEMSQHVCALSQT